MKLRANTTSHATSFNTSRRYFLNYYLIYWVLASSFSSSVQEQTQRDSHRHHHHHEQQHIQQIIRDSYAEVSAFIVLHFNEKCKLALHNCLFRTEWDKVFGGERISSLKQHEDEEALSLVANRDPNNKRKRRHSNHQNDSYYYCQPFLIGKFCVDDYMRRAGDDYESNFRCLNGSDKGNSPDQFKNSIYRDKCKFYYGYFFDAYNSAKTATKMTVTIITRTSFFSFLFFYLFYKFFDFF